MSTIFKDRVEVAGLGFNTKVPDEYGVYYYCDLLDNWDDTAPPSPVTASFTYNDGVVAGDRFPLKEQYIEFGGYIRAKDNWSLERGMDRLRARLAVDELRLVRHSPIPKAMTLRASGSVEFPQSIRSTTDNMARFLVQLMAPWPFKESPLPKIAEAGAYAGATYFRRYDANYRRSYDNYYRRYETDLPVVTIVRSDSLVINNEGSAVGYPTIEVFGPLGAGEWSLVNETTNERLGLDIDLGVGSQLTLDTKNKIALIMGQPVDYFLTGDWLSLARGLNRFRLLTSESNPDAYFRVLAHDTYR